jgi:hypothetical protein
VILKIKSEPVLANSSEIQPIHSNGTPQPGMQKIDAVIAVAKLKSANILKSSLIR